MRWPNSLLMVCYGGLKSGKEVEGNRKKMRVFMTTLKYFVPSSFTRPPHLCHPPIRDIHRKIAFHAHFTAFLNRFAQFGCAKRNVPEKVFANPFIPSGKRHFRKSAMPLFLPCGTIRWSGKTVFSRALHCNDFCESGAVSGPYLCRPE
jgi:hypothetical protein